MKHDTAYRHPQETWDSAKCAKVAKGIIRDGMGTPYPRGHFHHGHYAHGAHVTYNGGTVINGDWYPGESWPLPIVADGYKIEHTSLGYRLVKSE